MATLSRVLPALGVLPPQGQGRGQPSLADSKGMPELRRTRAPLLGQEHVRVHLRRGRDSRRIALLMPWAGTVPA